MKPKFGKPQECSGCVLEQKGYGYAPASGPAGAELLFVGESLGENEANYGAPFVGPAGAMLTKLCEMAGLDRERARIDNCVRCQPPGNWLAGAPWEHVALTTCRQYLDRTFAEKPKVVVTLGMTALRQVLGLHQKGIALDDFHGTVQRDPQDRFWVVPTFHPSYLLQGKHNLTGSGVWDLKQALAVLQVRTYGRTPS